MRTSDRYKGRNEMRLDEVEESLQQVRRELFFTQMVGVACVIFLGAGLIIAL